MAPVGLAFPGIISQHPLATTTIIPENLPYRPEIGNLHSFFPIPFRPHGARRGCGLQSRDEETEADTLWVHADWWKKMQLYGLGCFSIALFILFFTAWKSYVHKGFSSKQESTTPSPDLPSKNTLCLYQHIVCVCAYTHIAPPFTQMAKSLLSLAFSKTCYCGNLPNLFLKKVDKIRIWIPMSPSVSFNKHLLSASFF